MSIEPVTEQTLQDFSVYSSPSCTAKFNEELKEFEDLECEDNNITQNIINNNEIEDENKENNNNNINNTTEYENNFESPIRKQQSDIVKTPQSTSLLHRYSTPKRY